MSAAEGSSSSLSTSAHPSKVVLDAGLISSFRPAKVFKSPEYMQQGRQFTSIDFDDRGEHCVAVGQDETIHLWNVRTGKHTNKLYSKKYGADIVRFSHQSSSVLYASTKGNDTIRYHSLHDNRYLHYFQGHTSRVCTIQMSPVDDTFVSGAVSESLRLWDLRSKSCHAYVPCQGHPTAAYDPSGQVIALGFSERNTVLLYDSRKFTDTPFERYDLEDNAYLSQFSMPPRHPLITSLSFCPNPQSDHLLVGTAGDQHYVIDSFERRYKWRLVGHEGLGRVAEDPIVEGGEETQDDATTAGTNSNDSRGPSRLPEAGVSGEEVCWSPDGKFVLAGTATGAIVIWEIPGTEESQRLQEKQAQRNGGNVDISLQPVAKLDGPSGAVRAMAFSPRTAGEYRGGSGRL